jgi:hypothetical protein
LMNRIWRREVLRFVDAWACREGTPEDDEDNRGQTSQVEDEDIWSLESRAGMEMQTIQENKETAEMPFNQAAEQDGNSANTGN